MMRTNNRKTVLQNQHEGERKFAPLDFKSLSDDGFFEGYASLFNQKDMSGDIVMPGAFSTSLAHRKASGIRMLFQHDPNEPIGVWHEIVEDEHGLFVRGQLLHEVSKSMEILSLMRRGALDGLSIGFQTIKGKKERKGSIRRLFEIDLWEISIVTFPMLPEARISHVKSGALPTKREFERWLVRDAGFTRSQARLLIKSGYNLASKQDAAGENQERLLGSMRRAANRMRTVNV